MECNTVEFFIEKVRDLPCLWNMDHVAYRDSSKKDLAWERVAKQCRMANGREARTQWKKLQNSHREALRRRKPSSGPAQHLKPWKYEEIMKFIVSKFEPKDKEYTSYSLESHDTEDSVDNNSTEEVSVPESILPICYPDPLFPESEIKRERDQLDTPPSDGLTKLFESFCQKTRELPKYLQLRVQREVFAVVSRAEEEALSISSGSKNGCSSPSLASSHGYVTPNVSTDLQRDYCLVDYDRKFLRKCMDKCE